MTGLAPDEQATGALSHDLIICTRNRPGDLRTALESVATQTLLPDTVLIVDASDTDEPAETVERFASRQSHLNVRIMRTTPGLPAQRNLGARASAADVVHYIDDDVVLERNYLAAIVARFSTSQVLGVGGFVTNQPERSPRLWWRLALVDSRRQGVILPSGQNIIVWDPSECLKVDWLSGCSMSYRRHVVLEHLFDESLPGYALLEDADFSYRVSRVGPVLVEPRARLEHHVSPVERWDYSRRYRTAVRRRGWFVAKNMSRWNLVVFAYSVLAAILVQVGVSLAQRQRFGVRVAWWWLQGALDFLRGVK